MIKLTSGLSRVVSASTASWTRFGITVFTQIALVPVYLGSWSAQTYGAWLLCQAIWSVIVITDTAHQDYIGYECLRMGPGKRLAVTEFMCSAIPVALIISLLDLLIVWWLSESSYLGKWIDGNSDLIKQCELALLAQSITWILTGSQGGLLVRWLITFGYNAQLSWWGVLSALISSLVPAVVVVYGGNLLQAELALCCSMLLFHSIIFISIANIIRREKLRLVIPNIWIGLTSWRRSLWLIAKGLTEMSRQQGIRIILSPLVGTAEMATFATMRTGANFALQGLNTVASPVLPELMRYINDQDQHKMESAFAIVWMVLCAGLAPAVLIVQFLSPDLFPLWTHNKFIFNPWIFGALSLSVLVLALGQPAAIIIQGKNSIRAQFVISSIGTLVGIIGMIVFIPIYGLISASIALLVSELLCLFFNIYWASKIIQEDHLQWPWKSFRVVSASIITTLIGMTAIAYYPQKVALVFLILTLIFQMLVARWYWLNIPKLARSRLVNILSRIRIIKYYK